MNLPRKHYRLQLLVLGSLIGFLTAIFLIGIGFLVTDKAFSSPATPDMLADSAAYTPSFTVPKSGQPAPKFILSALAGGEIALADFSGPPVLINFWATWCGPCREEMPVLVEAYETWRSSGLIVLAVNMTAQDSLEDVQAFVDEYNLPFPILLDQDNHVTGELYRVMGVPMSFFITRDGHINDRHIGAMNREQVARYIQKFFEQKGRA